ncbi:MAG: hypothetical protein ACLFVB_09885 [Thermoplasmata archaeon]
MLSEKNKPRLTLLLILLVFISITAYSLNNAESKQKITVDEGYDEISVEYLPEPNIPERNYENYSVTATTYINDESTLKLKLKLESITVTDRVQTVRYTVTVIGDIKDNSQPAKLKIMPFRNKTSGARPVTIYNFNNNFLDMRNASFVDSKIGGDLNYDLFKIGNNDFKAHTLLLWDIPIEKCGNPYTLHNRAVLEGLSQDVTVTVDLNIEGAFEREEM